MLWETILPHKVTHTEAKKYICRKRNRLWKARDSLWKTRVFKLLPLSSIPWVRYCYQWVVVIKRRGIFALNTFLFTTYRPGARFAHLLHYTSDAIFSLIFFIMNE